MKPALRLALAAVLLLAALATWRGTALSHCEIPCGIYGDRLRVDLLFEDIATVEKSMLQIEDASVNFQQKVRWVQNKETHANKIQEVVTQYFMTQRVKPKAPGSDGSAKYLKQLTSLHEMLIFAMKAKQTTDPAHCAKMREHLHAFSAAYFSKEDLDHIKGHHKGHDHKK